MPEFWTSCLRSRPFWSRKRPLTNQGVIAVPFCGVGDSVQFETETKRTSLIPAGEAVLRIESPEGMREYPASVTDDGLVSVRLDGQVPSGPIVSGRLSWDGGSRDVVGRVVTDETSLGSSRLQLTAAAGVTQQTRISAALPTAACLKPASAWA